MKVEYSSIFNVFVVININRNFKKYVLSLWKFGISKSIFFSVGIGIETKAAAAELHAEI